MASVDTSIQFRTVEGRPYQIGEFLALRIVLTHSDREWLETCKSELEEKQYLVDKAHMGKDAQLLFFNNSYFAVVLDVTLKNHSGLQVLNYIKSKKASQKIILVTPSEGLLVDAGLTAEKRLKQGLDHVILHEQLSTENLEKLLQNWHVALGYSFIFFSFTKFANNAGIFKLTYYSL